MRRAARIGVLALALGAVALLLLLQALRPPAVEVPAARSAVFRDLILLEPGAPPRPGRTLRVEDGRIHSIETTPAAAARGDRYAGHFALPGLIDMHVHYPPRIALGNAELWSLLFLAHGVTAVRETGSIDGSIFEVRDAIRAGRIPGPRIFACGQILDGAPPSFPSNRVVRSPEEASRAVREQIERGADCIKVYNMLSVPVHEAILAAAARSGVPVVGHVPHRVEPDAAGIDDVQHLTGTPPPERAHELGVDFLVEDWAEVDENCMAQTVRTATTRDVAHTPTLVNARLRRQLVEPASWRADSGLRHLPRFWEGVWRTLWAPPYAAGDAAGEAAHDLFRERAGALTAALWRAGAAVHVGTDTLMPYVAPGSSLHGELRALSEAGLPREAAWRAATARAGAWLAPAGQPAAGLGTLAPGAPADLLLYRGNPLRSPERAELAAVVADGRLYDRDALEQALERFDAHFHGRLYESVMGALVAAVRSSYR